jgi:hypothetical protein
MAIRRITGSRSLAVSLLAVPTAAAQTHGQVNPNTQ